MTTINLIDTEKHLVFLGHGLFWFTVVKPEIDGEKQEGILHEEFCSKKKVLELAKEYNSKGIVCVALNERGEGKTKSEDVKKVTCLFFDVDVNKQLREANGYVSTDEQHIYAIGVAQKKIKTYLDSKGFCIDLIIDSGNGCQLFCKVDLDVSITGKKEEFKCKCETLSKELQTKFNDEIVNVDCITKDFNRRIKLAGTINKKDLKQKEDRLSKILYINEKIDVEKNNLAFEKISTDNLFINFENKEMGSEINTGFTDINQISKRDYKFWDLYNGKIEGYKTRSEAEIALVIKLKFYGFNKEECKEILLRSGIGKMQEKKGKALEDYFDLTYDNAIKFLEQNHPNKENKIKLIYDKDLKSMQIEPIEWIIENLIPKNSIVLLGGKRATLKSCLSLYFTYCISNGKPVFNKFSTSKLKVLYVDEENGIPILKERSEKIKAGLEINEGCNNVAFVCFSGLKLDNKNNIESLKSTIIEFKPDLIIIDSFRRIFRFDENDAGETSNIFIDVLRPIINEFNLSWLILHHLRKGNQFGVKDDLDEFRGSSDLVNFADVVLMTERPKGSVDKLTLKQPKCRVAQEMESKILKYTWTEDILSFEILGSFEEPVLSEELCSKAINKWLNDNQTTTFKTKEVIEIMKIQDYSRATINRAIELLINQNKIHRVKKGLYNVSMSQMSQDTLNTSIMNVSDVSYLYKQEQPRHEKENQEYQELVKDGIELTARDPPKSEISPEVLAVIKESFKGFKSEEVI